jgi:hypothetical protein
MYNLFVSGDPSAWNGEPHVFQHDRVLRGYSADQLVAKYGDLNDANVEAIKQFPALFMHEKRHQTPGKIGWITGIRHRNREVRIEYDIEPLLAPFPADRLLQLQWELDYTDWELNTTHWALKDVDLLPVLMDAGLLNPDYIAALPSGSKIKTYGLGQPAADIEARPSAFRLPVEPRDPNLVCAMMPFGPAFNDVYAAIQYAAQSAGMACQRADNIWEADEVIQDIFSLIYRSSIVICDFTGKNPNVFYEAGIAHTLGRSVVPIAQSEHDVPFDLKHHRYLQYLNNNEGLHDLVARLTPRLKTLGHRL